MRAKGRRQPTVFLGPLEISGYYENLERGFHEIGVRARLVKLHPDPFGYQQLQRNPWPARFASWVVLVHRKVAGPLKPATGGLYLVACLLVLAWSLPRFNSYVFSWGMSLLPRNVDIPLLRFFGKTVIVVLGHGSEARPPYMSTPPPGSPPFTREVLGRIDSETRRVARKVRRIERWATRAIGLPATGQFFMRPFVNFYALGVPTRNAAEAPLPLELKPVGSPEVVILHVPSKPEVKGSASIRQSMAVLTAKYPHVRYEELTGRPHSEILEAIGRATFVVDQLWSDIPMAVVGAEAAALGRATVIAGYAWDVWHRTLSPEEWPPTVIASPEAITSAIESCIVHVEAIRDLGQDAQKFVATKWSCAAVARKYLRVLSGDVPGKWLVDPAAIDYGLGCGVSRQNVDAMVKGLVAEYGVDSLRWARARQVYGLEKKP